MSTELSAQPSWNSLAFQPCEHYGLDIRLIPPSGYPRPWITIEIAGPDGTGFQPILGKVDTGTSLTLLTFDDARAIGIPRPTRSELWKRVLRSANRSRVKCYGHRVTVRVGADQGVPVVFPLEVGVVKKLANNLFGLDWTWQFCLAIDICSVHLLRH